MNRNAVGAASSREREGNSVDSEDPVIAAGSRSHGNRHAPTVQVYLYVND